MRIFINGKLIKSQILPMDKPTLDETLETFSFALLSDNNPMPYASCQSVQVITDSNEKINLFLVTDSVEPYSYSPTRWKHNITCTQNTRELSKHLVRNSSFTTPPYLEKKSYSACSSVLRESGLVYDLAPFCRTDHDTDYIREPAYLRMINGFAREKVKDSWFLLKCQTISGAVFHYSIERPNDIISDLTTFAPDASLNDVLMLYYEDEQSNQYSESLSPSDLGAVDGWYPLNKRVKINRVTELAKQGYNNFCILFAGSPVSGTVTTSPGFDNTIVRVISFQAELILETYNYNCYELLDLLCLRQQKQRRINGELIEDKRLFYIDSQSETGQLLLNTPAPNFIFTQLTMYECVAEVFRLFDAIFTMDENGYLGIEYFNERNGEDVTAKLKKVGQNSSSSEDKYTNGLVTYYQNAKSIETFPSVSLNNNNAWASIKTKGLAVPTGNSDFIFETAHKIDTMLETYIRYRNFSFNMQYRFSVPTPEDLYTYVECNNIDVVLDISHYILNNDLWTLLDGRKELYTQDYVNPYSAKVIDPSIIIQINSIFFNKDTNVIDISYNYEKPGWNQKLFNVCNMFECALARMLGAKWTWDDDGGTKPLCIKVTNFFNTPEWNQLFLRTKYVATFDGRTKIESIDRKYDGETLIDQYSGAVDLNKMGLNILGLSLKLGNPTLTVTQKITNWNNRIKQGDIYNYEGKIWVANVVAYTILGDGKVQATIQFVQNFNALAMRTQLLREKRMSNISNELTVKSEENVVDYVYFALTNLSDPARTEISTSSSILRFNLYASIGGAGIVDYYPSEMAILEPSITATMVYIPMIKYGSGNMICFEVSYDDSMSVGKQTKISDGWWVPTGVGYYTKIIKYTDEHGEFPLFNLYVVSSNEVGMYYDDFPVIDSISVNRNIQIRDFKYYKQPNEIFALNYQLCFLPHDSKLDFIGSRFINNNAFTNDFLRRASDLILYYRDDNFKYSVLDINGEGETTNITSVNAIDLSGTLSRFVFSLASNIRATSFAICERDGTILFASNRALNGNQITLTFYTNHHRIDNKVLEDL